MSQSDVTSNNKETNKSFCDELADCAFIIEGKEIKAHKLKLTYKSPVFEKMFFGQLASSRVTITDIAVEDFLQMLEFVYTGRVEIESVLQAWSLFYIAHKYLLHDFANVCVSYIQENFSVSNLILNYEYAEVYDVKDLQKACLSIVRDYVRGVFHDKCGYHMKPSSLLAILEQRSLNISNEDLVKCVLNWATAECDIQDMSLSAQNIIFVLRSLKILQYLVDLDFNISDSNSDELFLECCKLIKNMKQPDVPYRHYKKQHWCNFCKCRLNYKIAGRMMLRERDFLISYISVNQDTFLFGLVVATESTQFESTNKNVYEGSIRIQIGRVNDPDSQVITKISKCLPYEAVIYVPLSEVVLLECDKAYSVKIGYSNFDKNVKLSSVLCNYMSNKLCDKTGTVFSFDEMDGSVIKGVCYFPA